MFMQKYIFSLLVSLIAGISFSQTTTYTVTQTSLGIGTPASISGSLDIMLENALASANLGNHVKVNFNAPGLVNVDYPLPQINVTNPLGQITIQRDPTLMLTIDQGIKNTSGGTIGDGFYISNCQGDVNVKNLIINGFYTGVRLEGIEYSENVGNVLIEGNDMLFNNRGVWVFSSGSRLFRHVQILNNSIVYGGESPDLTFGIMLTLSNIEGSFEEDFDQLDLEIVDNTISNYRKGITLWVDERFVEQKFEVLIDHNLITVCEEGMSLTCPKLDRWTITNNIINEISLTGIWLSSETIPLSGSTSSFECNINFIESGNTLSLPPENTGNEITECKFHALYLFDLNDCYIVNMAMGGQIASGEGEAYYIRENLIQRPSNYETLPDVPLQPISWEGDVNENIPSPVLTTSDYDGYNLNVEYGTPGLFNVNAPFVVEFYETAQDGSFIQLLGSQDIATAADVPHYQSFFTDFSHPDNRIAMSTTSIGGEGIGTSEFTYFDLPQVPCDDCSSFKPATEERYWISAWVQEEHPDQVKSYEEANIQLSFTGDVSTFVNFYPTGEIIDGWQRIVGEFTMPEDIYQLRVHLNAHSEYDTYFDDIRLHPFNGSMKSYVYDGETFWLTSELDDNNYATFYEYDEEGGLIRIKKETSRGIVTIQETRSNTIKQEEEE